jgi:hypothetical protein
MHKTHSEQDRQYTKRRNIGALSLNHFAVEEQ